MNILALSKEFPSPVGPDRCSYLIEVPVSKDKGSHQGPKVEKEANPAGGYLHPHGWPLTCHCFKIRIRAEKQRNKRLDLEDAFLYSFYFSNQVEIQRTPGHSSTRAFVPDWWDNQQFPHGSSGLLLSVPLPNKIGLHTLTCCS